MKLFLRVLLAVVLLLATSQLAFAEESRPIFEQTTENVTLKLYGDNRVTIENRNLYPIRIRMVWINYNSVENTQWMVKLESGKKFLYISQNGPGREGIYIYADGAGLLAYIKLGVNITPHQILPN